ncbi:hypothetical protein EV13_0557 [Prochlorococcus sp. MIT 0702]|nr:hypothetical protein EV12_1759 [Prochlorococcus sp. MIT 0701]KGG30225.1 hypothetical protein EV13_0557 [Prochlorococcus sp. MIT 0702]KGG34956.1 hypothetical protein EV14_1000 [Prochlorococcus sp. MIT 0703]
MTDFRQGNHSFYELTDHSLFIETGSYYPNLGLIRNRIGRKVNQML